MNLSDPIRRPFLAIPLLVAALAMGACGDEGTGPALTADGSVEGLLFLDANGNGAFDPFQGDVGLPGVGIEVRSIEAGNVVQAGETAFHGGFSLSVPAGSHELHFDDGDVEPSLMICPNPVTVQVYANDRTIRNVAVGTSECG